MITDERRAKEHFEQQVKELKTQSANKIQNKILEAELEVANNKLKQAEAAVKETPPVLLSLQSEISSLKKQHRHAIHEVRKYRQRRNFQTHLFDEDVKLCFWTIEENPIE